MECTDFSIGETIISLNKYNGQKIVEAIQVLLASLQVKVN